MAVTERGASTCMHILGRVCFTFLRVRLGRLKVALVQDEGWASQALFPDGLVEALLRRHDDFLARLGRTAACSPSYHPPWHPGAARLVRLLRARLAALGGSALPELRRSHRAPSHRLGGSSGPPLKSPIPPPSTI